MTKPQKTREQLVAQAITQVSELKDLYTHAGHKTVVGIIDRIDKVLENPEQHKPDHVTPEQFEVDMLAFQLFIGVTALPILEENIDELLEATDEVDSTKVEAVGLVGTCIKVMVEVPQLIEELEPYSGREAKTK